MTCGANEIQKSKEKFQNRGKANTGLLKKIEVGSYEIFQTAVKKSQLHFAYVHRGIRLCPVFISVCKNCIILLIISFETRKYSVPT